MRWFVNDASLQGQFHSAAEFEPALRDLLDLRREEPARSSLYVSRTLGMQRTIGETTFAHAVQSLADRDIRVRVLQWVTQRGPFADDDRLEEADDLFFCQGIDVTDGGLGEAARRVAQRQDVATWSFVGGPLNFARTPLNVIHGLIQEPLATYDIPNVWTAELFRQQLIDSIPEPTSWVQLDNLLRLKFPRLLLADGTFNNSNLNAEPYSSAIGDRAHALCSHLHEYMASRNPDGSESERTIEIVRTLFTKATGAEPLFTGESASNQEEFKDQMTFDDPETSGRTIFAHWHGKIRHRFFRMHFEWPVPHSSQRLKVLYFGPKLTKG